MYVKEYEKEYENDERCWRITGLYSTEQYSILYLYTDMTYTVLYLIVTVS